MRLSAAEAQLALGIDVAALALLAPLWEALPRDAYLRDGGDYRARRHGCFTQDAGRRADCPSRTARTGSPPPTTPCTAA